MEKQVEQVKAPILVIILSWLLLLGGIFNFVASLLMIFIEPTFGLIGMVTSVMAIVIAFGFRKLKKWAFNTFVVLSVISLVVSVTEQIQTPSSMSIAAIVVNLIITAYIVYIRDIFKN